MTPTHQPFCVGLKPEAWFCLFRTSALHSKNFYPIFHVPSRYSSTAASFEASGSSLKSAKMAVTALPFPCRLVAGLLQLNTVSVPHEMSAAAIFH